MWWLLVSFPRHAVKTGWYISDAICELILKVNVNKDKEIFLFIFSFPHTFTRMDLDLELDEVAKDFLTLVSNDQVSRRVSRLDASISQLVRVSTEQDQSEDTLCLGHVDGRMLLLVVAYMEHHRGHVLWSQWDEDFMSHLTRDEVFELVCVSSYMDITDLIHLACSKVASYIREHDHEEKLILV
jgi:hypothetical protein